MAVRKSQEDTLFVKGSPEENLSKVQEALVRGGFTKVTSNSVFNHVTGNYKKFTVFGEIAISLLPKTDGTIMNIKATANVDNIFALFNSPTKKILDQFRNNYW